MDHYLGIDSPPVYHAPVEDVTWATFGRAVLRAHQLRTGGYCTCGRFWLACPVPVLARQYGLPLETVSTGR